MDLNPAEQAKLEGIMLKKQQKDFMRMFFRVTADCFDVCVADFSSKALSPREVFQNSQIDQVNKLRKLVFRNVQKNS